MSTLALPNTIINGASGDASKVQQNFDAIVTDSNVNLIKKDGTLQMTGQLSLLASDPTLADHATRKSYTDASIATAIATEVTNRNAAITTTTEARIGARVQRNATQAVVNITPAFITFDTEVWDYSTFFSAPNTNVSIPVGLAGLYLITFDVTYPTASGGMYADLYINGAWATVGTNAGWNTASTAAQITGTTMRTMGNPDWCSVRVTQNTGGAPINVTASLTLSRLSG